MSVEGVAYGAGGMPIEYRDPNKNLTQADFLKVMVAQLSQQDPFDAADSSKFMEDFMTMGNFQAMQDVSINMNKVYEMQQQMQAQSLVGLTVEVEWTDLGGSHVGVVESARVEDDKIIIMVDGVQHTSDEIVRILQPEEQPQS